MIELEPKITESEKAAFIECVTQGIQDAVITMNEVCYYAGFKP